MNKAPSANTQTTEETKVYRPYQWFFTSEVFGSMLLLIASVCAVILANSRFSHDYAHWLHYEISITFGEHVVSHSLLHWINDGLMALFFFTVGLEIKREVMVGELASPKLALLPVVAAAGGMLVPGLIYMAFNYGTPGANGWGIPVATDIAFSLGAIALLGKRLPVGLRIFLTAFAIADDLGAVLIIALFYTKTIVIQYLLAAAVCLLILAIANLFYVRWIPFYVVMGLATWVAVMGSGIHATIAGVAVAMLVPARGKYSPARFVKKVERIMSRLETNKEIDNYWYAIFISPQHLNAAHSLELACHHVETPLQRLEHALHPVVIYAILPLFAFFNAGLNMDGMSITQSILHPVTLGCLLGLLVGKPIGVTAASYLAVKRGWAALPDNVKWTHLLGAGMLGGIGFTMSLFVSGLSFTDVQNLNYSKLGVLTGSVLSALAGLAFLGMASLKEGKTYEEQL